jgi:hypothetical protein
MVYIICHQRTAMMIRMLLLTNYLQKIKASDDSGNHDPGYPTPINAQARMGTSIVLKQCFIRAAINGDRGIEAGINETRKIHIGVVRIEIPIVKKLAGLYTSAWIKLQLGIGDDRSNGSFRPEK